MLVDNVEEFNKILRDFVEKDVPTAFVRRQIDIAVIMYRSLVHYTPKLTGLAKGNWRVAVNAPKSDEGIGEGNDAVPRPLAEQAIRARLGGLGPSGSAKANKTFTIYNNLRYIVYLEDGSSQKAPQGITGPALADTITYINAYMAGKKWA
jgi:hypothetical protein